MQTIATAKKLVAFKGAVAVRALVGVLGLVLIRYPAMRTKA